MTLFDHTEASEQGRQSPHSGGQLYRILHTYQIQPLSDYYLLFLSTLSLIPNSWVEIILEEKERKTHYSDELTS